LKEFRIEIPEGIICELVNKGEKLHPRRFRAVKPVFIYIIHPYIYIGHIEVRTHWTQGHIYVIHWTQEYINITH